MTDSPSNNLWRLLEVLARRRGLILGTVIVVTIGAVVVSLLLPKWYESSALILPPKNVSFSTGGVAGLAEVTSVVEGLNLPVMVTPSDVYARMLASRTVAEHVIDSFQLQTRYRTSGPLETYLALMKHARFQVTDEGLLRVSVEDRDPQVAAELTNAFVSELDQLNRQIASRRAVQSRMFIEERVKQVKTQLDSARKAFESFQVSNRAVDFDEQTRLAMEQAISLKVSLSQLEIELQMNEQMLGADNPDLVDKRRRRDIIKGQLAVLEKGNPDSSFFSLPLASVPELKGNYEMLYSRVRVNEQLYTMLLEQLEQAKLQENEELPTISVLDYGKVPEIRNRPRRTLIVASAAAGSFVVAIVLALLLEYFARLKETDPDSHRRAMFVINAFFGWLPGVRRNPTR